VGSYEEAALGGGGMTRTTRGGAEGGGENLVSFYTVLVLVTDAGSVFFFPAFGMYVGTCFLVSV